ncbi:MAG: hypothetical protein IT293_01620 [Deltaproteobacteria bacterium]|nr:hypothetical protein [Deltaproteobacteria bacterium]
MREASQRPSRSKARTAAESSEAETTLHRLRARGERLLQWFPELRRTWQRDAEPNLEALLGQLQALGGQVGRRAQKTGRDLEARVERLLGDLERQAVRGLGPLLSRANLASGSDLADVHERLQDLEARLAPLAGRHAELAERHDALAAREADLARRHTELAERDTELGAALDAVRMTLMEARADAIERLREMTMRLTASEELQHDLGRVHEHLDALSKEQVARSLDIGKLHDRLVRLEMRMGDLVKEQGVQVNLQQETERRLVDIDHAAGEAARVAQYVHNQVEGAAADGRATDARLTALMSARNGDHDELTRLADLLGSIHQTLRQVDLRLGDLGERYAAVRDEIANLAVRVSHLELAPTQPVSATLLVGSTEGH